MLGQRIRYVGYVRVSSFDQNPGRQLEHVQVDKVSPTRQSGKDIRRPELERPLAFVREGGMVVVHSMDRLARNHDDLRHLVQGLPQRGVRTRIREGALAFTGEDSPIANLMLSVMGAFAEFERALIREPQREGICITPSSGISLTSSTSCTLSATITTLIAYTARFTALRRLNRHGSSQQIRRKSADILGEHIATVCFYALSQPKLGFRHPQAFRLLVVA